MEIGLDRRIDSTQSRGYCTKRYQQYEDKQQVLGRPTPRRTVYILSLLDRTLRNRQLRRAMW